MLIRDFLNGKLNIIHIIIIVLLYLYKYLISPEITHIKTYLNRA